MNNILNTPFYFNILIHSTLLFTFLYLFFTLYLSKFVKTVTNSELTHIIDEQISEKSFLNVFNNTMNEQIDKNLFLNSLNNQINEQIDKNSLNNPINEQIDKNSLDNTMYASYYKQINKYIDTKNSFLNKFINQNNVSYYKNIFSKEPTNLKLINKGVFDKLFQILILIYIIVILVGIYMYSTGNITLFEIGGILLENIILFIFIGAFEYLFFSNIASKFIPILPSEAYKLVYKNLQDNFA